MSASSTTDASRALDRRIGSEVCAQIASLGSSEIEDPRQAPDEGSGRELLDFTRDLRERRRWVGPERAVALADGPGAAQPKRTSRVAKRRRAERRAYQPTA